jgi:hypothetical protein
MNNSTYKSAFDAAGTGLMSALLIGVSMNSNMPPDMLYLATTSLAAPVAYSLKTAQLCMKGSEEMCARLYPGKFHSEDFWINS